MGRYLVRRLIQGVFIVLIITIVVFIVSRMSADPLAAYATNPRITAEDKARLRAALGLDQPMYVQYVYWLGNAAQGNFGYSFTTKQKVTDLIADRFPQTMVLMLSSLFVIVVLSLALGVYSAVRQYSLGDNIITAISFIGYSMPVFFIGLSLIYIFAVGFKNAGLPYLPTGTDIWNQSDPIEWIRHLILPVITLAAIQIAGYTRYLRSSLLEVLHQDYIRTARAKGLAERVMILRHALKNAALPFVTVLGLDVPFLFGGALVTETIFSWPGMGRLFWEHAEQGDFPVMMAILLITSILVVSGQIVVDIAYTFLDPRIRLA